MFFVITRYNEEVSWIREYSDDYIIYNKGKDDLVGYKAIKRPNYGGNQYDICHFIHENYDNLPDLICFLQGYPFDHCKKEKLDLLVKNTCFTPIESYEDIPETDSHVKDVDGGYMEHNTGWYIAANNEELLSKNHKITCKFTYGELMRNLFVDYEDVSWIRFTPASQYIVEKKDCLQYPKEFWKYLMDLFPTTKVNGGTEAHIIERAFYYIFKGTYKSRF